MKILVSGISGLGGHLAPHLIASGHHVIGLSRDPRRVAVDVHVAAGDAATGEGLDDAMTGVDVAYFLINTYEQSNTEGFVAGDRRVARNFAAAANRAGVKRIVYLGVPPISRGARSSKHIDSRLEVEDILLDAVPDSVGIGAFTIVSPRSRSFRVIMQMLRTNRVVALPPWRRHAMQPIDIRDVFDCLVAAATDPTVGGQRLRIAGPKTMSWEELARRIVKEMGLKRTFIPLPGNLPLAARHALATRNGGNPALIVPLLESLDAGHIVLDRNDAITLGVSLRPIEQTIRDAVAEFTDGRWLLTEGAPFEPVKST